MEYTPSVTRVVQLFNWAEGEDDHLDQEIDIKNTRYKQFDVQCKLTVHLLPCLFLSLPPPPPPKIPLNIPTSTSIPTQSNPQLTISPSIPDNSHLPKPPNPTPGIPIFNLISNNTKSPRAKPQHAKHPPPNRGLHNNPSPLHHRKSRIRTLHLSNINTMASIHESLAISRLVQCLPIMLVLSGWSCLLCLLIDLCLCWARVGVWVKVEVSRGLLPLRFRIRLLVRLGDGLGGLWLLLRMLGGRFRGGCSGVGCLEVFPRQLLLMLGCLLGGLLREGG